MENREFHGRPGHAVNDDEEDKDDEEDNDDPSPLTCFNRMFKLKGLFLTDVENNSWNLVLKFSTPSYGTNNIFINSFIYYNFQWL